MTEYYSKNGRDFIENVVSATNLANNLAAVDMESIEQLTDTGGKHWRFGVECKNTNQFTSRTIKNTKTRSYYISSNWVECNGMEGKIGIGIPPTVLITPSRAASNNLQTIKKLA